MKQEYLVDSNDVGQKWQRLDLCCNEVCIQLFIKKLVLPAKESKTRGKGSIFENYFFYLLDTGN